MIGRHESAIAVKTGLLVFYVCVYCVCLGEPYFELFTKTGLARHGGALVVSERATGVSRRTARQNRCVIKNSAYYSARYDISL